ncbi:hypothetical protein P4J32_26540 [Bacillus cereus]|nr:hypothetical protein [Bacillus thuringiensis]MEB9661153.1 hypothetical protein [Bacillus cereus]
MKIILYSIATLTFFSGLSQESVIANVVFSLLAMALTAVTDHIVEMEEGR